MKFIISSLLVLAIASCNTANTTSNTATTPNLDTTQTVSATNSQPAKRLCFATQNSRDSVAINMEVAQQIVTGTLTYKIFEKDSNTGTIQGVMNGDTLFANYLFQSEGVQSTREVAMLIKGETAVEGYGEMEERDGKTMFKNHNAIDFGKGITLKKIICN